MGNSLSNLDLAAAEIVTPLIGASVTGGIYGIANAIKLKPADAWVKFLFTGTSGIGLFMYDKYLSGNREKRQVKYNNSNSNGISNPAGDLVGQDAGYMPPIPQVATARRPRADYNKPYEGPHAETSSESGLGTESSNTQNIISRQGSSFIDRYLTYKPYTPQPTYLWENIPLYISGYCCCYSCTFIMRKVYVGVMRRYIKY